LLPFCKVEVALPQAPPHLSGGVDNVHQLQNPAAPRLNMKSKTSLLVAVLSLVIMLRSAFGISLYFEDQLHDPSTIKEHNGVYWTFGTGKGVPSRWSTNLLTWQIGDTVFPIGTWPAWINEINPSFDGTFWAPDVIYFSGKYWVYYTAPGVNGGSSAIGVASSPSLNNPVWTDHGMVVSDNTEPLSSGGEKIGCIDAGLFIDANGGIWMAYGTHYGGIHLRPIDPNTGKRLNENRWGIVGNNGKWNEYEAASGIYINGYYYMFATLGACCDGNNSSYYIVMGRSTSPTGPYLDKIGRDMWNYGGTPVLKTDGNQLAPGHYGYLNKNVSLL
jgi:arabinan endo-1,5-alpha-L-arabinosidase